MTIFSVQNFQIFFSEIRFETYQLVPYDLQMIPDLENIKETEKGKVQNMYS